MYSGPFCFWNVDRSIYGPPDGPEDPVVADATDSDYERADYELELMAEGV